MRNPVLYEQTVQLLRDVTVKYREVTGVGHGDLNSVLSEPGVTVEGAEEAVDAFMAVAETAGGVEHVAISALFRLAFACGEEEAWRAVIEADARWLGLVLLVRGVQGLPEPQRGEAWAAAIRDKMGGGDDV